MFDFAGGFVGDFAGAFVGGFSGELAVGVLGGFAGDFAFFLGGGFFFGAGFAGTFLFRPPPRVLAILLIFLSASICLASKNW